MDFQGVDEFGREYFSVETAPGRLGIALRESDKGHVVVDSCEDMKTIIATSDLGPSDRQRMQRAYETIQKGDRLVAIDSSSVVLSRLSDVISRLSKLAARKRQLTFARYFATQFQPAATTSEAAGYDIERFVLVRVPAGPMGLVLSNQVGNCGAFIEDFQALPDGTMSKLARHPKLYRGCQLFQVNGTRVASLTRDEVVAHLTTLKDQPKELIFYQATCSDCESLFQIDWKPTPNSNVEGCFDDQQPLKCVVTRAFVSSSSASAATIVQPGDVLLRVNTIDVTAKTRVQALQLLVHNDPTNGSIGKTLTFYHPRQQLDPLPECHKIALEPGPLGLNLDPSTPQHARIAGFTSPNDAIRKCFAHCSQFIPGSFIIAINQLDVSQHSLFEISTLLSKLRDTPKEILVANSSLLQHLLSRRRFVCVQVPKGPLGINFDSSKPEFAIVSGFYNIEPGKKSLLELQGQVAIGSVLVKINDLNITALSLTHVSELLKKLAHLPKRLVFLNREALVASGSPRKEQDAITKFVDVRVTAGPLGIDLKHSLSNKVILDKITPNAQPALVQHGGVFEGAELCALDGFDLTDLTLDQVFSWLKLLAKHDKVLTFSLPVAKYDQLWTNCGAAKSDALLHVVTTKELEILHFETPLTVFASETTSAAIDANEALVSRIASGSTSFLSRITGSSSPRASEADSSALLKQIPLKSRLVAIDSIDVRSLQLGQIISALEALQGTQKRLSFDIKPGINAVTTSIKAPAPPPPVIASPPGSPIGPTDATRLQIPMTTVPQLSPPKDQQAFMSTPPSSPVATTSKPVEPVPAQLEMLQKAADALLSPLSSPSAQSSSPGGTGPGSSPVHPQRASQTGSSPVVPTSPSPPSPHSAQAPPAPLVSCLSSPMLFTNETTRPAISPQKSMSSLSPLHIKPLPVATTNATKPSNGDKSNATSSATSPTSGDKPVDASLVGKDTEFTVSMASWNGSRTWSRLVVDVASKRLVLEPVQKSGGTSPKKPNAIAMNEIVSFEALKGSPRRNVSANEVDTKVVLHLAKKKIEFEMRFVEETQQLKATLQHWVPTLHIIS